MGTDSFFPLSKRTRAAAGYGHDAETQLFVDRSHRLVERRLELRCCTAAEGKPAHDSARH